MSPARSMSMQNACWHLPSRGKRSLRSSTVRVSSPIPSYVRRESSTRSAFSRKRVEVDASLGRHLLEERRRRSATGASSAAVQPKRAARRPSSPAFQRANGSAVARSASSSVAISFSSSISDVATESANQSR